MGLSDKNSLPHSSNPYNNTIPGAIRPETPSAQATPSAEVPTQEDFEEMYQRSNIMENPNG